MPRHVVGATVLCLVVAASFACSEAPDPLMASVHPEHVLAAMTVPYAPGVHVAAVTALDGAGYAPEGMNDWGEIVGSYTNPPNVFPSAAFKWQGSRGLTLLVAPGDDQYGAAGVNDSGQVALGVGTDTGARPAIWDWFGNVRRLRLVSTYQNTNYLPSCTIQGINDHGVAFGSCNIVGLLGEIPGGTVPTLWTAYGTPDPLFPGAGSVPIQGAIYALSDAGYVAGYQATQGSLATGFVFATATKDMRVLPVLATDGQAAESKALAVNDSGWAAGLTQSSTTPCGLVLTRAVAWLQNGTARDLGVCGQAIGVTDDGIIIGNASDSSGTIPPPHYAFIWTAATGPLRLPGLEGGAALAKETITAVAINHVHQILGTIVTSAGLQRTVVWTLPQ
jgi:hypothetical protein